MAGITLAQAETALAAWIAAESALANSQEYEIDTGNGRRRLKRADAAEVTEKIKFWDAKVKELTPSGQRRVRYLVPE